jgi:MerR family copper efflux transcriptional regulator
MYIGEVAKLTGASLKAIRHYEALGLLGAVSRLGAYRVYAPNELLLIQLIKQAQGLGFRLAELAPLLVGRTGEPDWLAFAAAIDAKRLSVSAEIARLEALDGRLQQVAGEIISCLVAADAVQSLTQQRSVVLVSAR